MGTPNEVSTLENDYSEPCPTQVEGSDRSIVAPPTTIASKGSGLVLRGGNLDMYLDYPRGAVVVGRSPRRPERRTRRMAATRVPRVTAIISVPIALISGRR